MNISSGLALFLLVSMPSIWRVAGERCVEDYDKKPRIRDDCDYCMTVETPVGSPTNYRLCGLASSKSREVLLQDLLDQMKAKNVEEIMNASRRVINRGCDLQCKENSSKKCQVKTLQPTPATIDCCKGDFCSGRTGAE